MMDVLCWYVSSSVDWNWTWLESLTLFSGEQNAQWCVCSQTQEHNRTTPTIHFSFCLYLAASKIIHAKLTHINHKSEFAVAVCHIQWRQYCLGYQDLFFFFFLQSDRKDKGKTRIQKEEKVISFYFLYYYYYYYYYLGCIHQTYK